MKKSLYDISWKVSETQYRDDPALSYSIIAKYAREGFNNLSTLFDRVESPSLLFGSVVDCLITDTQEGFDRRFFVADFPELPDSQKKMVDYLWQCNHEKYSSLVDVPNKDIIEASEFLSFQLNWKPETRAKVIKENGGEYYVLLTLAEGREVISQSLYSDALACADSLRISDATKFYFEKDNPFEQDIERLYQLKFKGEYDGIPLRCMTDLIIVNYKEGTIQPIDLKTTKDVITFEDSFYKWGYYHQAQIYSELIRQNIARDEYFSNFKLLPYLFIAIDRYRKIPIIFRFRRTFCKTALWTEQDGWKPNWREILKELNFHLTHPEVKLPYKMYIDYIKNGGILDIEKYCSGYLEGKYVDDSPVIWKDVPGWEGYYKVSNTGRVLRLERKVWSPRNKAFSTFPEKLLPLQTVSSGKNHKSYVGVTLTRDNEIYKEFVHRLVAQAFIPNPNNLPFVNHKDENPLNNNVSNLEWCTEEYNSNYGSRNTQISVNLGVSIEQYTLEGEFIKEYRSAAEACRENGWPANKQSNISAVCRGIRKSSLGFIWKFKETKIDDRECS